MNSSPKIPDRIGRCRIISILGRGATATVYRAIQEGPHGFEHEIALKLFDPALVASHPAVVAMIVDEARIASRLKHPGIVRILDLVEEDGQLYTLMDLVDGPSMRQILDSARLARMNPDPAAIIWVLAEACEGLHAAHTTAHPDGSDVGLVHRDIKPGNILITRSGEVKLSDFGIALFADRLADATAHGQLKGTPAYMSPEQVFGEPMDARSDIFSMGLTLFTLCTTRLVFSGPSPMKIAVRIAEEPMDAQAAELDGLLAGLGVVFSRACAKDPEERYPTAAALGRALRKIYDGLDSPKGALDLLNTWTIDDPETNGTIYPQDLSEDEEEADTDPNLALLFVDTEGDVNKEEETLEPDSTRAAKISPSLARVPELAEEPTKKNPNLGHLSSEPRPTPVRGLKPLEGMPRKGIDSRPGPHPVPAAAPSAPAHPNAAHPPLPSRPERDYRGRVIQRKTVNPNSLVVSKTERIVVVGMGIFLVLLVLAILLAKSTDKWLAPTAGTPIIVPEVPAPPVEVSPEVQPSPEVTPTKETVETTPTPQTEPLPVPQKKSRARPRKAPKKKSQASSKVAASDPATDAAAAPPGTLTVNTYPYSQVWVDGISHGRTPLKSLSLPVGLHEIKMVFPTLANREETQRVRIQTGKKETLFRRVSDSKK